MDERIAIVGGGFTSLYVTYRLLNMFPRSNYPNLTIDIYEQGPRLGGRILTKNSHGFIMEYGPMRFESFLQPKFANLLQELDVDTKNFPPYTAPFIPPSYDKITFQEIQAIESDKTLPPAFALLKYALKHVLNEQWDVDNDDIRDPSRNERKNLLKRFGRFQGDFLYNVGLWDTLAHVLSKPAIDYIMQNGTFYHMIAVNPNAADIIAFILDMLATCKYHLITIDGGTESLIEKLLVRVMDGRVAIHTDTKVTAFSTIPWYNKNQVRLSFHNDREKIYDRVIFTCQKSGLQNINGFEKFPLVHQHFNSVFTIKLYKIFAVLENPPWNETNIPPPNFNADKIPCREVHYSYNEETKKGMVMIYGDVPSLHYWRTFTKSFLLLNDAIDYMPSHNENDRLKDHVQHYLRTMFPSHRHFNIIDCGILDWSSPPYRTGVHMWRPGFQSEKIMKLMANFGDLAPHIHICGETYSTFQGFLEGCIRSADQVIEKISHNQLLI